MSQDHLYNEEELLHRIAKGDQDATKTLVDRYYPRFDERKLQKTPGKETGDF